MANPEHIKLIKQGVEKWSMWNILHPDIHPDFNGAKLSGINLKGAFLNFANFKGADLSYADLRNTNLNDVNLMWAVLDGANLAGAHFLQAILMRTSLDGAELSGASFHNSIIVDVDLGKTKGLESVSHLGPSEISLGTMKLSEGRIPTAFLRGCGLSDWQIESAKLYRLELSNEEITSVLYRVHELRAGQPLQIRPLFISYTHTDGRFVDAMEGHLNEHGVRFWRDVHHSTAGRLERQIDRAIRLNPTVLLILSEHSVRSDWVEHEARLARKLELEMGRDVLCPVALDDSWKTCRWPERLREQITEYNILDFSGWRDEDKFQHMFRRLLDGLDLFYK